VGKNWFVLKQIPLKQSLNDTNHTQEEPNNMIERFNNVKIQHPINPADQTHFTHSKSNYHAMSSLLKQPESLTTSSSYFPKIINK